MREPFFAGELPLPHDGGIAMPPGPQWRCRLLPAPGVAGQPLSTLQRQHALALLQQLRPAGITLAPPVPHPAGLCCHAAADADGRVPAYALLRGDRSVEMVAVLPTGYWPPHAHAWWPGVYEIPLLQQITPLLLPLADALALPAPCSLQMTLLALQGSALIAKRQQGSERAYPLPPGVDRIELPAVRLDGFDAERRRALIQALDQVRRGAGAGTATAFYL